MSWQSTARVKFESIGDSIPDHWRLATFPSSEEQRDVTGVYICSFLSQREIEITEKDASGIVEKTASGQWTAEEVIKAFCHRASLAHQLVNPSEREPWCLQRS